MKKTNWGSEGNPIKGGVLLKPKPPAPKHPPGGSPGPGSLQPWLKSKATFYARARHFIRQFRLLMKTWDIHVFEAARIAWHSAKTMELD